MSETPGSGTDDAPTPGATDDTTGGAAGPSTIAVVSVHEGGTDDAGTDGADDAAAAPVIAVWHVQLAPQLTGDRLSGAWLVDAGTAGTDGTDQAEDTLRNLFTGTGVLMVAGAVEPDVVKRARDGAGAGRVDLAATVAALRAHVTELKERVAEEKAKPGREKLTNPRFPAIADVEPIDFPHVGEDAAGPALAWARGLEELTAVWSEIESQRRRRDYLRDPWGPDARPVPLVLG